MFGLGEQYTEADSLGLFLTGANSDGGEQSDPDLSLGNYRSSSRVEQIGFSINHSIPGIIIERIGGVNGVGLGSLETINGNSLRWTAPNDTPGEAILIANGQTRMLQSSSNTAKFIVVSCHTTSKLIGTATVSLVPVYNNVIGSSNVPSGEWLVKLRCFAMKNLNSNNKLKHLKVWIGTLAMQQISDAGQLGSSGSGTIETTGSFIDWPDTGFCRITTASGSLREIVYYSARTDSVLTVPAAGRGLLDTSATTGAMDDYLNCVPGIKIAKETPTEGAFTTLSDEHDTEAVAGLSWTTGIDKESGLNISSLDWNEMIGIWIWLVVVEDRVAMPIMKNMLKWQFDVYDLEIFEAL